MAFLKGKSRDLLWCSLAKKLSITFSACFIQDLVYLLSAETVRRRWCLARTSYFSKNQRVLSCAVSLFLPFW